MRAVIRNGIRRVFVLWALWSLFMHQVGTVTDGGVLNDAAVQRVPAAVEAAPASDLVHQGEMR